LGVTLIFINQLRQKIGVTFGPAETTPGGNALKFYSSVRLDVRRIGQVKVSEEAIGARTRVKVAKNKCAAPFRMAEFDIRWGKGIDTAAELLDRALDLGIVDKSGAHLSFAGEKLGLGREKARQAIVETEQLAGALRSAIEEASGAAPCAVEA
jgi:recombination protein RecA